jgi:hypothetical protein
LIIAIAIMAVVSFVVVGVSPRTFGSQHFDASLWSRRRWPGCGSCSGRSLARPGLAIGNAVTPGKGYRDGPFQSESELRDLLDRPVSAP